MESTVDIKKNTISVIVPIYNIESYLKECVDSILAQTYSDLEIILVDDGSTDSCPYICDEYQKTDSRIHVIHKSNGGLSDARNAGIDYSSGRYIAFVDGDDYLDEKTYEILLKAIQRDEADVAFGVTKRLYRDLQDNEADGSYQLIEGNLIMDAFICAEKKPHILKAAWDKLYLRETIGEVRFLKGKLYEDGPFNTEVLSRCKKCAFVGEIVYYYRDVRPGNISSTINTERLFTDKFPIWRMQIDKLAEMGRYDLMLKQQQMFYTEVIKYYNIIRKSNTEDKSEYLKRMNCIVLDGKEEICSILRKDAIKTKFRIKIILFYFYCYLRRCLIHG